MNFIRNGFGTGSLRRRPSASQHEVPRNKEADHDLACFETYQCHCEQLETTMQCIQGSKGEDYVLVATTHLEHLMTFVCKELKSSLVPRPSPCLDHLLRSEVLSKICSWSVENQEEDLIVATSVAIDSLLAADKSGGKDFNLLRNQQISRPIALLLSKYADDINKGKVVNAKFEATLVSVSWYVCVLIMNQPSYLDQYYDVATVDMEPKFPLMTLLIQNLHRSGRQGQTSRDNLKLLMSLAKENQLLTHYIALQSNFCPIVATGLSAVYSDLPRLLPKHIEEAGVISALDLGAFKDVENFVTSLEFCDSILETAPWLIVRQLLDFCYSGFLVPVVGSALFQDATALDVKLLDSPNNVNTMKEILAATCYLTLMLRRIRNRGLIGIFVRLLLGHEHEHRPVIDYLVQRLSSQTELRLATLHLFNAMIDLNCEDVMLNLVLRHLLTCGHVMRSQRGVLQETDLNCLSAAKYLSLVPRACCNRDQQVKTKEENESNESPFRIRSWSRITEDPNETRYGQLTFSPSSRRSNDSIQFTEKQPSPASCQRLKNYLKDEFHQIQKCVNASRQWTYLYNGKNPPISEAIRMLTDDDIDEVPQLNGHDTTDKSLEDAADPEPNPKAPAEYPPVDPMDIYTFCMEQLSSCLTEINTASSGQSSGYESFGIPRPDGSFDENSFFSKDVQDDLEFWSLMRDDEIDSPPVVSAETELESAEVTHQGPPSIGPFLESLVQSVDGWLNNSVEVNLALSSIFSRLAVYAHPLLRSLILNPYLTLQPSIPSLAVCIATLRQRIDSALMVHENVPRMIAEARTALQHRLGPVVNENRDKSTALVKQRPSSKIVGLFSSLVRREQPESIREEITSNVSFGSVNYHPQKANVSDGSDPIGRHIALCAVLLEEWLHELAALCMEHAVHFIPLTIPRTEL